jgi:hypothetical protein
LTRTEKMLIFKDNKKIRKMAKHTSNNGLFRQDAVIAQLRKDARGNDNGSAVAQSKTTKYLVKAKEDKVRISFYQPK